MPKSFFWELIKKVMVTTFLSRNKKETNMVTNQKMRKNGSNSDGPFGFWTFQKCPKSSSERQTWKSDFLRIYIRSYFTFLSYIFVCYCAW
jgi:hypothetical protein